MARIARPRALGIGTRVRLFVFGLALRDLVVVGTFAGVSFFALLVGLAVNLDFVWVCVVLVINPFFVPVEICVSVVTDITTSAMTDFPGVDGLAAR